MVGNPYTGHAGPLLGVSSDNNEYRFVLARAFGLALLRLLGALRCPLKSNRYNIIDGKDIKDAGRNLRSS